MNEFELQAWERELFAWWRRVERQPPGALRSILCALGDELARARSDGDEGRRDAIERGFAELRALYDDTRDDDHAFV
jgi:hypothetical protein